MDEKTKTALLGSIEKWQKIVDGTGVDQLARNCPLCALFLITDCEGCPVRGKTDLSNCMGSPYQRWLLYCNYDHDCKGRYAKTPEALEAAKAELAFLKSLLPSDTL